MKITNQKKGCKRFFDKYRFLSSSLFSLPNKLVDDIRKTLRDLKKNFLDMKL